MWQLGEVGTATIVPVALGGTFAKFHVSTCYWPVRADVPPGALHLLTGPA